MTSRDPELDKLSSLLGRCLGRIDEQAYRLLQLDDGGTTEPVPAVPGSIYYRGQVRVLVDERTGSA